MDKSDKGQDAPMSEVRLQDIPSIKNLLKDARNFDAFRRSMPLLRPVFRLLGMDVGKMDELVARGEALAPATEEVASLPDRFNNLFARRGWIAYDSLNLEVVRAAVARAEGGDLEGAESILVDHYDENTIRLKLLLLGSLEVFRPRLPLAEKALIDYLAGRHHAAVPVVLALTDGLVNDLQDHGFFAMGADMTAWDSIAAHEAGLGRLGKILNRPRKKTTTETITVPYRHGILHGRDLGYDNKPVAAKSWAALFAVGDWAAKIARGHKTAPPDQPKPSLLDNLRSIHESKQEIERMRDWRPRVLTLGDNVPLTGDSTVYSAGSPERALVQFLKYWKARNYGKMVGLLPAWIRRLEPTGTMAGELRARYSPKPLLSFAIEKIADVGPAVTEISVRCEYADGRGSEVKEFRIFYEDAKGEVTMRGKPGGAWVVYA